MLGVFTSDEADEEGDEIKGAAEMVSGEDSYNVATQRGGGRSAGSLNV